VKIVTRYWLVVEPLIIYSGSKLVVKNKWTVLNSTSETTVNTASADEFKLSIGNGFIESENAKLCK
jgi:hypothetical protein